jgi:hypothetical protein
VAETCPASQHLQLTIHGFEATKLKSSDIAHKVTSLKVKHSRTINKRWSFSTGLNVAAKWLVILLRISDIPDSNLGQETGYPDCASWFSSIPPGKCRIVPKLCHDRFDPYHFQFIIYRSSCHSMLSSLSY